MRYDLAFRTSGYCATFLTSFDFATDVFENVVLPGLGGAGCRIIGVIADQDRSNVQFTEYGPPERAGLLYHFAKRKVAGSFHPKIALQLGKQRGRLMVGSSNSTSGGLAGNLEAVSMLEVDTTATWAIPLLASALAYSARIVRPRTAPCVCSSVRHWMRRPGRPGRAPSRGRRPRRRQPSRVRRRE